MEPRSCFIRNKEHKWVLGELHAWGTDSEVTVHGTRIFPVAIVSYGESGNILAVEVSRVRFKNPY